MPCPLPIVLMVMPGLLYALATAFSICFSAVLVARASPDTLNKSV